MAYEPIPKNKQKPAGFPGESTSTTFDTFADPIANPSAPGSAYPSANNAPLGGSGQDKSGSAAGGSTVGAGVFGQGGHTDTTSGGMVAGTPGSTQATGSTQPPGAPPALLSQPGAYEQWVKDHIGQFDDPTRTEGLYDSGASQPGSSAYQDWYQVHGGDFDTPGKRESTFGDVYGGFMGVPTDSAFNFSAPSIGAGREVFGKASGALSDPGALEQAFLEAGGSFDDPGAFEKWAQQYAGDVMNKGYTENLYESGMGRLDPYYDNAEKRAIGGAQRSSAARGGFNTGLAAQQESDISANIRGQQAQQTEALAPLADAAKLNRYKLGSDLEQMNQDDYSNRIFGKFKLAGDAQAAEEGRYKNLAGIAGIADAGTAAEGQIGEAAARDSANSQNDAARNRIAALSGAGQAAESADASSRQRTLDSGGAAKTAEDEAAQRMKEKLDAAGGADLAERDRLLTGATLAQGQQNAGQDRIMGMIQTGMGLDNKESDLVTGIYGDMKNVDAVDDAWLQAEAEKYGVSMGEMKDIAGALGKLIEIGGKLAA